MGRMKREIKQQETIQITQTSGRHSAEEKREFEGYSQSLGYTRTQRVQIIKPARNIDEKQPATTPCIPLKWSLSKPVSYLFSQRCQSGSPLQDDSHIPAEKRAVATGLSVTGGIRNLSLRKLFTETKVANKELSSITEGEERSVNREEKRIYWVEGQVENKREDGLYLGTARCSAMLGFTV